ncbi:MAG TPA: ABC transporter ATP-binding protein [Acidimicrobiales bacterium]|jgi:ATP-binding cassette subfamily B protein|nr:ABC transporter ATP-binding protein [Acidimicrobiales bacterium]
MTIAGPSRGWIRRLLPWLAPHRREVWLALLGALVGSGIAAGVPAVYQIVIDDVILHHRSALWPWLVLLVAAAVVTFVATYVRRYLGGRVSLDVQYDLRNAIFDQLQRLDSARHDELHTGQLVSRANSDVSLLQGLLSFLPLMIGNVLLVLTSLIVMFLYSPLLAVVTLVVVPAIAFTGYRMRERTFPANWDAQQREGEVATVVEEAVSGVRVVKGFGQEQRELAHLIDQAGVLYGSRVRAVRLQARYQPVLQAIPVLGQVAVLVLGGWMAIHHQLSIGTFLAFATYLLQLAAPARMLAMVMLVAQQARAGAERVFDLLESTPTVVERRDAGALAAVRGEVHFAGVRFGYLSSEPVLDGFDFEVAAGETVALVGSSGSGKSTAALLLPRFYDVQAGAVYVDGTDIRTVTLNSLRSQIGVVFEESFLFSDTVRANIAYGRPDATDAEVTAAAKAAEADGFISALPDGYGTVVGERGLSLSGGQRQRVALARALITDPRILILDDATSAVDTQVEDEIHATLRRVMRGRTTLLIAHRRSTLRLADRIVVVDRGRVLDQGSHEELSGRCAHYRELLGGALEVGAGDSGPAGGAAGAHVDGRVGGVTPAAWPAAAVDTGRRDGGAPMGDLAGLGAGLRRGGGGGAGHSGGGAHWMGMLAPTPELMAKVAALEPTNDSPDVDLDAQTRWDPNFTLRRFLGPFRRPLALGLLLVMADAVATLAGPLLIRSGLDRGVERGSIAALLVVSAAFFAVTVADYVDSVFQVFITGRTAERLLFALRARIWAQLQRLGVDFYDRELSGRIMTRMTTDVDALSSLLQSGLINALVALFTFAGVGVALVAINWVLGLVTLSVVVPLAAATVAYRRLSARAYGTARERVAVVNANLQESLSGVRVAHAFAREGRNQRDFRRLSGSYLDARLTAQRLVAIYFPFLAFLSDVAAALVLGVGSVLVARHSLTAGGLVAFLLYLDLFFNPIQQLSQTFDSYQQAGASMAQINGLMRVPTTTPPPLRPAPAWPVQGRIRFEGVRFSYPGTTAEALRGVDLVIEPGQTVALVGETGAGKSTTIKLVTRFYDPTAGAVTVDGRDLRDLDMTWFRRQIGYVPQEAFLFSGTLRDNIAYGRPDASDAEVEAAARAVGAHDFVAALPGGYLHVVNERGRSLSAGQRQLIALARAEVVDPAILLLDEATSNLDLPTESKVARAMGVVASGRTTVLIAHRLQTAARADRVVVMDQGVVVEDGTHDGLLARGGRYASMWAAFEVGAGTSADVGAA